jgi:hypothetical protein
MGHGNPSPDWNGDSMRGDNLYSYSTIAVEADTGELKWYMQFVPHDVHDWDATQVPLLVDADLRGQPHKLIYWAHTSGIGSLKISGDGGVNFRRNESCSPRLRRNSISVWAWRLSG